MLRAFASLCLFAAAALLVYMASPVSFYLKPKQERLYSLWRADFQKLSQNQDFKKMLSNLNSVEVVFNDPEVADEFSGFKTPFKEQESGTYLLKVSLTRWIEPKEYGFVIEHEVFDQNDNKLHEFGRTYRVGYIF